MQCVCVCDMGSTPFPPPMHVYRLRVAAKGEENQFIAWRRRRRRQRRRPRRLPGGGKRGKEEGEREVRCTCVLFFSGKVVGGEGGEGGGEGKGGKKPRIWATPEKDLVLFSLP